MDGLQRTELTAGPYRLIRVLGSGGMGVVHEAWDTRLDRRVALKMLHPHLLADPSILARFEREAKKAARIEHPNVVRVYRIDSFNQHTVIEMQYIEGAPLNTLLRTGPLSPMHAAAVLRQILEALQACHDHGIIHCDLKPGNLLVTRHGQVILGDFGIARALHDCGSMESASGPMSGPMWGTPQYSPPEAWEGGAVSPQWDLYAAGALTYEAVTGVPPFRGATPAALMRAVLTDSPSALRVERPEVSDAFSDLVGALMARDPAARPASAREALKLLKNTPEYEMNTQSTEPLQIPKSAPQAPTNARVEHSRNTRENRTRLPLVVVSAMLLVLVLVAIAFVYRRKHPIPAMPPSSGIAAHGPGTTAPPPQVSVAASNPGAEDLLVAQGVPYFSDDDGVHGRELWCLNELTGEARMLADLAPGPESSNPRHFMERPHGGFVFAATTPAEGEELWYCSDMGGGHFEAHLIKDIIPGAMGSNPFPLAANDTLVLFFATTLASGRELWCTNTQEGQTAMVADLLPGVNNSMPSTARVCADADGAYVVAIADAERGCVLFRYDCRSNSIWEIGDVGEDTGYMANIGKRLAFASTDMDHGYELWIYDESSQKCGMIADLWPGPPSSSPSQFYAFGDSVLFQARTAETGLEPWISDGTPSGTTLLRDINPGPGDSDPYGFVTAGNRTFFRAKDDAYGQELWVRDGTSDGTKRVADVMPGTGSGNPYNLSPLGESLFFTADDGIHGEELWRAVLIDGTWQAKLVIDLYPGSQGSEPHQLQWDTDRIGYFLGKTPDARAVLYRLDLITDEPWHASAVAFPSVKRPDAL